MRSKKESPAIVGHDIINVYAMVEKLLSPSNDVRIAIVYATSFVSPLDTNTFLIALISRLCFRPIHTQLLFTRAQSTNTGLTRSKNIPFEKIFQKLKDCANIVILVNQGRRPHNAIATCCR